MMATRTRTGSSFAKSVTAKGNEQLLQTNNNESPLLRLLRKPQSSPEKGFPSAAWAMVGDTGEVSQPLPAACGKRVQFHANSDGS